MTTPSSPPSAITNYRKTNIFATSRKFFTLAATTLSTAFADPGTTIRYEQRNFDPLPILGWTSHSSPDWGWQVYEDFTLPADEILSKVRWSGYHHDPSNPSATPSTTEWSISIHSDDKGKPGTLLYSRTAAISEVRIISTKPAIDNSGIPLELLELEIDLTSPFTIQANKRYWISLFSSGSNFTTRFSWASGMPDRAETRRQLDANGSCWQAPAGSTNNEAAGSVLGDVAMVLIGRPADDADQDGMRDDWEIEHGLDATLDDSQDDPDKDGLANLREFELQSSPQNPDTDGDGLSDGVESNRGVYLGSHDTGTSPILADTDRDGLTDNQEDPLSEVSLNSDIHTTDPNLSDTDRDGYEDGLEIEGKFDPTNPASFPPLTLLGTGAGALIGGDLTDPENDAADTGSSGHNAIIAASRNGNPALADEPYNAFDNRLGVYRDYLCCAGELSWPWWSWVSATFDEPIVLTHFTVAAANLVEQNVSTFEIQGSNDGGHTWDTIFIRIAPDEPLFTEEFQVLRFDSGIHYTLPPAYRSIRLYALHEEQAFRLGELEYFGTPHTTAITGINPGSEQISLTWSSIPGVTYQLQQSSDLNTWTTAQSGIPSKGATTDSSLPVSAHRFFRVSED
ncbi:hypothetical protein V2O64_06895 [Verrucomicrobiaceae bacterium 227]